MEISRWSRISLVVGFCSIVLAMVLGVSIGLFSGYVGGKTDAFLMRVADIQLSFPAILTLLQSLVAMPWLPA